MKRIFVLIAAVGFTTTASAQSGFQKVEEVQTVGTSEINKASDILI